MKGLEARRGDCFVDVRDLVDVSEYENVSQELLDLLSINLTTTIHKLLLQGNQIKNHFQKKFNAPIGIFSGEPGEALIKRFRQIRANHARLTTRQTNNLDIIRKMWEYTSFFE